MKIHVGWCVGGDDYVFADTFSPTRREAIDKVNYYVHYEPDKVRPDIPHVGYKKLKRRGLVRAHKMFIEVEK